MINNVNNATSFQASYIDKINIQKLNNKNKYVPYQANLVELNLSDLKALEEINKKWKNNWLCDEFINWAKDYFGTKKFLKEYDFLITVVDGIAFLILEIIAFAVGSKNQYIED